MAVMNGFFGNSLLDYQNRCMQDQSQQALSNQLNNQFGPLPTAPKEDDTLLLLTEDME